MPVKKKKKNQFCVKNKKSEVIRDISRRIMVGELWAQIYPQIGQLQAIKSMAAI